jgi:hypothetical protein
VTHSPFFGADLFVCVVCTCAEAAAAARHAASERADAAAAAAAAAAASHEQQVRTEREAAETKLQAEVERGASAAAAAAAKLQEEVERGTAAAAAHAAAMEVERAAGAERLRANEQHAEEAAARAAAEAASEWEHAKKRAASERAAAAEQLARARSAAEAQAAAAAEAAAEAAKAAAAELERERTAAKVAAEEGRARDEATRLDGSERERVLSEALEEARREHARAIETERARLESCLDAERSACAQTVSTVQQRAEADAQRWAAEMEAASAREQQLRTAALASVSMRATELQTELDGLRASCADDVASRVSEGTASLRQEVANLSAQLQASREELHTLQARTGEQIKSEALALVEKANRLGRGLPPPVRAPSATPTAHSSPTSASATHAPPPSAASYAPPMHTRTAPVDAADRSAADASGAPLEVTADASGGFLPPRLGGSGSRPTTNASVSKGGTPSQPPKLSLPALPHGAQQGDGATQPAPSPSKPRGRRGLLVPRWGTTAAAGENAAR